MGNSEDDKNSFQVSFVELYFTSQWGQIGLNHPIWRDRVKIEILNLSDYTRFIVLDNSTPWLFINLKRDPKFNFMIWRGYLLCPRRPDIYFDMVILLSKEYPKVIPRYFLEKSILDYSGKMYTKNKWIDHLSKKKFFIIYDYDMTEAVGAWEPTIGNAHFFVRIIWYWFVAIQRLIILKWNKHHGFNAQTYFFLYYTL
jgi:hypothetical protein